MQGNHRFNKRRLAWAISMALSTMAYHPAAYTQEKSAEATLPEVKVQASSGNEKARKNGYTASKGVSATKTDTQLIESPQSISVINEQQLQEQGSQTLQEAVRYSVGVTSEAYGLDNRGDWLFIRGTEHTEYRDGLRVQAQTYDMPRPNPYSLERIEVLRGPASVLYGSGTVGGIVNLVSKKPQAEQKRELNVQYGSYNHKQVGIDLTGPANESGSVLYRLVGAYNDSGTQVDHTDIKNWFIAPSLTFLPSDKTSLTLLGNFQRNQTDGATAAFPPHSGTISPNPNGRIPTSLFSGERGYDHHYLSQNSLGWQFAHEFDERWTFRQNARWSKSKLDYATLYPAIFTGVGGNPFVDANRRLVDRFGYANKQETSVFGVDNQLQSKWNLGETHHTVLLGVDHLWVKQHNRNGGSFSDTDFDLFNPVYGIVPASELATVTDQADQRVRQTGVYLQDQIRIGHWTVTAGVRNDTVTNKIESSEQQQDSAFSKRFGLVYLADNGLAPYASYSESFNPTVGVSATGKNFEPREGEQVEVGLRYQPVNTRNMYSVALFDLKESNRVVFDPAIGGNVQKAGVKARGVELDSLTSITNKLDLIANYSYTHARSDDGLGNETHVAEVHPHVATIWATYRFSLAGYEGFRAGAGARYIGANRDETNTLEVPSVTLFDAMLGYETEKWRASINALNITDETYVASCLSRGDCWYGSRARAVASVTLKF